jgi:hypothetical protein
MAGEQQDSNRTRTAEEIEAELLTIEDPSDSDDGDDGDQSHSAAAATRNAEEEAGRKGWVPKDKFKGDPSKWVDAKTFNARGERFAINLQREVETLKAKLESFEGTKAAFVKFHEEAMAKKDAEIKEAISALRVQRTQAIREGEDELAVQLEDRIELLRDQQKEVKALPATSEAKAAPNLEDPLLVEWIEDGNQWFQDEPKLRDYALAVGEDLLKKGETLRGRKFLDKVTAIMAEEFPRKFRQQQPATSRASAVEGGSSGRSANTGGAGGRTERDLPAEDRALMRQFIAEGYTTKEKFLASYWSRNG